MKYANSPHNYLHCYDIVAQCRNETIMILFDEEITLFLALGANIQHVYVGDAMMQKRVTIYMIFHKL